jgi:IS605 OrfB family transposase
VCQSRKWATIFVPKCGRVRFRLSRPLPDNHGMARVTLDRAGRWHVGFAAPQPMVRRLPTGRTVGVDLGITHTITVSDRSFGLCGDTGPLFDVRGLTDAEAQRKRRLERRLARQQKGSRRREITKHRLNKLRAKEVHRRRDFIEKATTAFVRAYDVVCIEDLKVKEMMGSAAGTIDNPGRNVAQKRRLNRGIASQGWATFRRRLTDKAATCGVTVVTVTPAFTSQRCADCGHTCPDNREKQAVFRCRACGHEVNADLNVANNILAAGLAVTARGGTSDSGPGEARTTRGVLAA